MNFIAAFVGKQSCTHADRRAGRVNRPVLRVLRSRTAVDKVVAQVSNLPYRRASSLPPSAPSHAPEHPDGLPIGNQRYSRLETCATPNWPDSVNGPCGRVRVAVQQSDG